MSLSQVVAALNGAISPTGQIDLYAASADPALANLRPVLARFAITAAFAVVAAKVNPAATSVTLTGTAKWGLPDAPPANVCPAAIRLACVAQGTDTVIFTLSLTMTQPDWTFDATFAGLPPTQTVQRAAVMPATSFLVGLRLHNATFAAASDALAGTGLTLNGNLPLARFWQPWKTLIGPWPLQLSGNVLLPASYNLPPRLDLLATATGSQIKLAYSLPNLSGLILEDIGFGLVSQPASGSGDDAETAYSVLTLTGRLQVSTLVVRLICPILAAGRVWHFIVEFEDGDQVADDQLRALFGLPDLPTPATFLPIPSFRFQSIELYLDSTSYEVINVAASIVSTQPWRSPAPFISLQEVGISWLWGTTPIDGTETGWLAATIFGTLVFETTKPIHIDASVTIPDWSAKADLRAGDVIPIGEAFNNFFGSPGPPTKSDMNIVGLGIESDPQEQSYYAYADVIFGQPPALPQLVTLADGSTMLDEGDPPEQGWTIDLIVTSITLQGLSFNISVVGGEASGGIAATFLFGQGQGSEPAAFMLSADYPGPALTHPEGWTFAGDLLPGAAIDLTGLVGRFLGQTTVPGWVPQLQVDRLYFRFNTGDYEHKAYAFGGTVSAGWRPKIFGTTVKISASVALDMAKAGNNPKASGALQLAFTINRLELGAGLTLGVPEPIYNFIVKFGDGAFKGVTSWRGDGEKRHQVITLQLTGITVGGMLEYLVNLAAPTIGYTLDPPWNILNQIELSRFTLTLDPQDSIVELVYAANADLVFMRLDTIGIRYTRGTGSGVSLILTGSMLGQQFDGDDLEWDVIDDPPPKLPGEGKTFIRLRYLGLGQRVQLSKLPDTVADTLALLEHELDEPKPGENPLDGQGVTWSAESQWLIGLDVGLLDTLDLGIVFNDPWLYGLSIALNGDKAGSLAGLRFEILYKKISDSIGMFRIELTLPEAFRTFEFGAVSVTLGTVVIEIYTNGNFKIDLGFPYNRNYARSFTVQVFPFLGRGGIYFGLLNGTTSRRVPRITNGNFAPVIELGVGLAVGVGKEIHVGPLSGGIYVELEVIFEGVLGWFHPSAAGGDTEVYYWAQGVAAIHGKLYGAVDFKVIKVSVTLEAYAAATVTLEAYRPTLFRLEVSVSAEAEIKILFVRVSFSFEVDLDVSFEIGQARTPPWILSADQSGLVHAPSQAALALGVDSHALRTSRINPRGASRRRLTAPLRRPERRLAALYADHQTRSLAKAPNWQPTKKVFDGTPYPSPRTAGLISLPSFTAADIPLSWTATAPVNVNPRYRFALQLFAPTGVSNHALNAAQSKVRSAALSSRAVHEDDLDALAADTLVRGLLLYAIYAIPDGPTKANDMVNAGQLTALGRILNDPTAAAGGFAEDKLEDFFKTNVNLAISGVPSGTLGDKVPSAMAMALPPFLNWTCPQTDPVNFATDNPIGPLYIWGAQVAAAAFSPSGKPPPGPPADPLTDYRSFASHLFSDWSLLIARSAVREALTALDNLTLDAATATQTLNDIAEAQPRAPIGYAVRPGDTVATVADALGATVEELTYLNRDLTDTLKTTPAGGTISILLGISPEVLALDNPTAILQKKSLALGVIAIPVVAADTLNILAKRYGTTAVTILGAPGQDADAKLLGAGKTFDAPATSWSAAPAGFTALRAAAVFYTRYAGVPLGADPDADAANWYAQALADLNRDVIKTNADPRTQELPPGLTLTTPTKLYDATPVRNGYTTVPGDTPVRIGAALNLEQNPTTALPPGWPAFRDGVTGSGGSYAIPTYPGVAIAPGDTLAMLARRTIVNWVSNGATPPVWSASWSGLAAWIGGAFVLAPLTLITIPGVTTDDKTSYTFASLAAAFGLTLTDVGQRLAKVAGLVTGLALKVRHLPTDTVESLVDKVAASALAGIAHEASRFLFSGQEIPVPIAVPGQDGHVKASPSRVSPLFDQSRQQWDLPVDKSLPSAVALSLTLLAQKNWITFNTSIVIDETTDQAALAAHNPALAAGRTLPHGAIALTGTSSSLAFSFTNQQVLDAVPATGLAWLPYRTAAAIKVRANTPITYGLAPHIAVQTAIDLPVPGFDVAHKTLSLHPFPPALLTRARTPVPKDKTPTGYDVFASISGTADAKLVVNCTFATLIGFTIRRLAETPGVYQLIGAAVEQLPLLLDLIAYLKTSGVTPGTVAKLTLPPAVTAADPNGIAVLDGDAWLIKSNLSTETVPPSLGLVADDPPPLCRAGLAAPADFALLLWEGSTVGGIGYNFGASGGISDGAFDANDQATLHLLVIAGAQQAAPLANRGRTLLSFNTSLLAVDQGIADGATLFAEAYQNPDPKKRDPSEYVAQALVPAGSIGLTMTLTRPIVPGSGGTNEDALRQQYSLLAVTADSAANCPYVVPASGLPAPPQATDGKDLTALERAQARRRGELTDPAPKPYWAYQCVLPICRFGPASLAPKIDELPPPLDDPYRGLGGAATQPQVNFQLGFGDVLGNRTATANNDTLMVDVGYTDPLKGPTGWPAVNASYVIAATSGAVTLTLNFAAKAQTLMPALDQRGDALVEAAKRQRDDYATAYYQYAQTGLTFTAQTTLQMTDAAPGSPPTSLTLAGAAGLCVLATGGYLTAVGATLYAPVHPAAGLLSAVVASYGIGWDMLAAVNAAVPLVAIFGSSVPLTVPAYAVMASGDSATSIAAAATTRAGWPTPSASAILSDSANADDLPLKLGAVLAYTARAVTLPSTAPTLAKAADAFATSAGWLAADSAADAILITGFAFIVDGVTVTVGTTPVPGGNSKVATFADAVAAFIDLGVHLSVYDLGQTYADIPGLLTPSAIAHAAHYVVSGAATLTANPSGATTADLVANNLTTTNLYEAGALIALGDFGTGMPPTVTPTDTDTLAGLAARYACPPAALLHANGTLTVIADTKLAIPGAVALPLSTSITAPFTLRATDTLDGIAANLDLVAAPDKATALAERNRDLPGTVTQGLTFNVTVGGNAVPVKTTGLTTFAAVLAAVKVTAPAVTMTDVAAAFGTAGRLATGSLLLCPPALMTSATAPSAITLRYGVSATAFALANGGVAGLLASGVSLAAPDSAITSIQTAANDTLNSVVGRFNAAYLRANKPASVTIAALIDANPDATLFAAQARALLPPADIALTTPISATGPYPKPGAAFPLTVELTVARPNELVHKDFRGTSVEIMRAVIAAPAAAATAGASMTFNVFAAALIAALPNLRLATAKLPNHTADLWAVDFGVNGITSVALARGVTFKDDKGKDTKIARMIGLAPLYGQLVSRTEVPIAPLAQGSLDPAATVKHDYQGIDVEIWAARFLADLDRLLGAGPAAAIDAIAALRPQFARLIAAKATLQSAIPADLASIFAVNPKDGPSIPRAVTDPNLAAGLVEAKRVFGEALGVSLASAWATAAIVQYDASVDSSWTRAADPAGTAALYGEARSKAGEAPANRPWRLAAGKVSLSDTAPLLTLPLSVSDPGAQKHVVLDLSYATSNIEIHRKAVGAAPGYTSSDWLAMTPVLADAKAQPRTNIPPALKVDLGLTDVPIPLKAFPGLPLLVTQTGLGDVNEPPTLAGAPLWSFRLVYAHEHTPQDQVGVTIDLNLSPPPLRAWHDGVTQDLFTALAQYVAVADELNGLLAGLTNAAKGVTPTTLAAAVTTAADLANAVAGLWTTRLANGVSRSASSGSDDWIASQTYPFHAVVTYQEGTRLVVSYKLSRLAGAIGAGIAWPTVRCRKPDGGWTDFDVQSTSVDSRTYEPHGGPLLVTEWPHFELTWASLNIGAVQNGRVRLDVVRNADLLDDTGPATADRFVYRTATVTASDIVTPAINRSTTLPMAGATLTAALQAAFDALFPPANRRADLKLTLGLFYGYTLVDGPDPLVSELAAGLLPDTTLDEQTSAVVAGALATWQDNVKPTSAGGLWIVALTLYSSFDPGKRALLTVERMTYPLIG